MFKQLMALPNAGAIIEALADTTPLIRPVADVTEGVRAYSLGAWEPTSIDTVVVTEAGHWFRVGDVAEDDLGSWRCRGCRTVPNGALLDLEFGRCTTPPNSQDIASALLARTAVAA